MFDLTSHFIDGAHDCDDIISCRRVLQPGK